MTLIGQEQNAAMTDIALKEYFERRLDDLERRLDDRFAWSEQAVAKAEQLMGNRLAAMNEFRDALKDQANRLATRIELEALASQVHELRREKANLDGRLLVVSACISLVMTLVLWALTKFVSP